MRVLLALVLLLSLTAAAEPKTTLPDVEDEVMCVECRTALNVSQSPVADQERAFIRELIADGKTKEQIKAALVEAYGPDVLAEPESKGFDVDRLAGAGSARRPGRVRRGAARAPVAADQRTGARDDGPELGPDDKRRLDAELAAYDR